MKIKKLQLVLMHCCCVFGMMVTEVIAKPVPCFIDVELSAYGSTTCKSYMTPRVNYSKQLNLLTRRSHGTFKSGGEN